MHYIKLTEVRVELDISDELLDTVCAEGLIQIKNTLEDERVISAEDAERLRLGLLLMRDMDVNLPGVEIILRLRDNLLDMHQQFNEIMQALNEELRQRMK